jgi:ABC-type multidrug transport system fused ATPase/permease subunit
VSHIYRVIGTEDCLFYGFVSRRKPLIDEDADGRTLDVVAGQIELQDVTFSYPSRPDVVIFKNFSLNIPAGNILALVGQSGSGKSTVVQLVERFYDPEAGRVGYHEMQQPRSQPDVVHCWSIFTGLSGVGEIESLRT